jgi:hypothetical protein
MVALLLATFAIYGAFSFPGLWRDWYVPSSAIVFVVAWLAIAALPLVLLRRTSPILIMVVMGILTIALRTGMALVVHGRVPLGDARNYVILAQHLSEGRGLVIFDPFMRIETHALYPPVYPILLSGWGAAMGLSTGSLTLIGMIVDLATAAAMVALAQRLGNRSVGIAAAWLYLIWPSVLSSAPLAQKEGVCALLAVLLALQWVKTAQETKLQAVRFAGGDAEGDTRTGAPRWRAAVPLGLTAGLLALTQPGEAPLAVLFGLVTATVCGWRQMIAIGLRALPFAVLVLMPWWIRNAILFGSFVPLTSAGGYGLWIGNNPDATGHWMAPPRQLDGMPEIQLGKAAAALAVEWIVLHPLTFVRLTATKALRAWGVAESGASRFADLRPSITPAIAAVIFGVSQVAHLGLLAGAAFATFTRKAPRATLSALLVLACVAQTLVFGVWFEFGERHRDFATPFLLLLVAFGCSSAAACRRTRRANADQAIIPGDLMR